MSWTLNPEYATGASGVMFADLDSVFALQGEAITRDPLSTVHKVWVGDRFYYVKRYTGAGKHLRRFLGRPRVQAEWENLLHFHAWGIPAATVVGFGMERRAGAFVRGALITEEIVGTQDLAQVGKGGDPRMQDDKWVRHVAGQVAHATQMMHGQGFAHNDLKWRNILVDQQPLADVYMIDCPGGGFWRGSLLEHRKVKDLACLDKLAKRFLSFRQRIRFYKVYSGKVKLDAGDRKRLARIDRYFEGRE